VHRKDSGRSLWRSLTPSYAVTLLKEESSQRQVNLPGVQNGEFRYPCGSPSQVSTEWTDSVVSNRPGLSASLPGRRLSTHCPRRPVAIVVLDTIDREAVPADHCHCACSYRLLSRRPPLLIRCISWYNLHRFIMSLFVTLLVIP